MDGTSCEEAMRAGPSMSGMASNWNVLRLPIASERGPPITLPMKAPMRKVLTTTPAEGTVNPEIRKFVQEWAGKVWRNIVEV
jgi:hypothetical protein